MRQGRKVIVTGAEATCQRRVTWLRHMASLTQMSPGESEPVAGLIMGPEMQHDARRGELDKPSTGLTSFRQQVRGGACKKSCVRLER